MTIIGVIPVKKNSVRFPNKNFMELNGDYLINRAIARLMPNVDRIIISTDAVEDVIRIVSSIDAVESKEWFNPDVTVEIVQRSDRVINGDLQSSVPAAEAIVKGSWCTEDLVVLTQVTTPLIRSQMIARCIAIWENTPGLDLLVTVNPDYAPNGGVYICTAEHMMRQGSLYSGRVYLYQIPFAAGVDIDYPHQLAVAGAIDRGDIS